ncbi:hypothetical protein [Bradyrhizobium centrosematis]|uniref:hypothetical protein n=1 Tax=Bradyrhizobium centrosematis TaxID=1300039 RepID=UPI00388E51CB
MNFYYLPSITGKNIWLLGQALFFAVYFTGIVLTFNDAQNVLTSFAATSEGVKP